VAIEAQAAFVRSIVDRFKDVPYVSWDLINEPSFSNPHRIFAGNQPNNDPTEVAAAAVALLRERKPATEPVASRPAATPEEPGTTPAWAKLFISVGERDGLRAGDLLGAITGEAGVDGRQVGKIDIHESHTVAEVHDSVARKVIKALNGTTIRGRAVRADFDRPRRGAPPPRRPR